MSEKISIFRTLRFAGENIFVNKKHLDDVPINANGICEDSKQKFDSLHPEKPKALDSNILFKTLEFKPSKEFSYEKRRDIEKSEEDLIISACKRKNISESELENIKYSLGYKTKDAIYKKPCVAVVGQTKAGKSSLLNCILQDKVVPQKMMRQTARVTYVTHCKFKFVAYMENSMLTKIDLDEDVKEEDVDLKFKDRNKKGKISIEVRAGTPNPIVQNGFDIVDSPGLNENPALNDLCERMEKSLLPLLIYVVEGRSGQLQDKDIEDIKKIRSRTPQLKILFFTTKLNRSKYDRVMYNEKKAKKGIPDDQDLAGESDMEVAQRRLENVLKKLKYHLFVPSTANILESRDFHGADIKNIIEMRIQTTEKTLSECQLFNIELMKWFEESLMMYLRDKLSRPLAEEIECIQGALKEVLEKARSIVYNSEDQEVKKYVKEFTEKLAVQYALLLDIQTAIFKMINPTKPILKLGKSAQSIVEKAFLIGYKDPIIIRSYRQTFVDFRNSERLQKIAMEIYYSSHLEHRNSLSILGISFQSTSEGWRFAAYYPYLEEGSLKDYLKKKVQRKDLKEELKERLKFCIDMANGIAFLHQRHIIHQDLDLKNIMVRRISDSNDKEGSKFEAVLRDYGLAKSFGFIEHTDRVGSLLYIAPELLPGPDSLQPEGYTTAVDVYSFAICVWQTLSFYLTEEYSNFYAKFALDCEFDQDAVEKLVVEGARPEDRQHIPEEISLLLKRCWSPNSNERPSFIKTLKELPYDFEDSDPMFDKTIIDVLKECYDKIEAN